MVGTQVWLLFTSSFWLVARWTTMLATQLNLIPGLYELHQSARNLDAMDLGSPHWPWCPCKQLLPVATQSCTRAYRTISMCG